MVATIYEIEIGLFIYSLAQELFYKLLATGRPPALVASLRYDQVAGRKQGDIFGQGDNFRTRGHFRTRGNFRTRGHFRLLQCGPG